MNDTKQSENNRPLAKPFRFNSFRFGVKRLFFWIPYLDRVFGKTTVVAQIWKWWTERFCKRSNIQKAAEIIDSGGLVAFPTETVYGLGANTFNSEAVKQIFKMKKRPADNPLIVHIADIADLKKLTNNIPDITATLCKKFWPGPLTLIFKKSKFVPNEITAGGDTVAVRIPNNKIALKLIKKSGVPIVAPSANLSGKPSPTKAEHVFQDFGNKIFILDGGDCEIGLESTVLDITTETPTILRYGGISLKELKKVLKTVQIHPSLLNRPLSKPLSPALPRCSYNDEFFGKRSNKKEKKKESELLKSPGMKYKHYAPKAELFLIEQEKINDYIVKYKNTGKKVGVLATIESKNNYPEAELVLVVGSKKKPKIIAHNLFAVLRSFDEQKIDIILAEYFDENEIGGAIMDRLRRASTNK